VSSSDGHVAAFAPAGGRMLWSRMIAGRLTPPAITRDRVIVGSSTNTFYSLDRRNGKVRWRWVSGGNPVGAASDRDMVFLTALDNTVKAVNRGNGHQRWREVITTRPTHAPLASGGVVVVVGDSPTLSAFAAKNGEAMGSYDVRAKIFGPPLIDPAPRPFSVAMVVITREGNVVALTPEAMLLGELPAQPLTAIPGRQLMREQPPAGRHPR
jgi:outer membrane protein assembly factor BamB